MPVIHREIFTGFTS